MAGHSKWHNIQERKGKMDKKRGKLFTKLGNEITMAAKAGTDPEINASLREAINKAKSFNLPNDNIERAIKKAAGNLAGVNFENITYEGYGTNGVAVIVKAYTDNKNRTAGSIRHLFDKFGGNLGTSGSVKFMFDRKGQFIVEKTDNIDEDELMMFAIENDAEDFKVEDNVYEIISSPEDYLKVKKALEDYGIKFLEEGIVEIPTTLTKLSLEQSEKLSKFLDALEDDDDVDDVYHNADFPEDFKG
ncbi:MAG: YebC/PmpR family DNA-binding transcriptional regulator [Clostridium sp.]|nr:YebC/PmpR family DNA-binding transcriptional regulator [Clostridium sp.]